MLFNSIDFAIFLPIVFVLYWFVTQKNLKLQNLLIVIASYVFYGWWDWRFLSLIIFSTLVDYIIGVLLSKEKSFSKRKMYLGISIVVNLGFLGFFKYYNFFLDNFITAFSFFGQSISRSGLNIILPVGISFYTFQTLSYSIDVYRKKLEPTKDFIAFSAFVCFFPQLVAGPIERATNLLPQFYKKRQFEYEKAVDGMRQILWGLFKKVVIADNCAILVNTIFENQESYSGSSLLIGAFLFSFQIYGDFSGYSDIAIGTSRLFGFNLMQNFAFPYFSRDIAEFWRRWHISLSTWFRDYLYFPLGGSRGTVFKTVINVFIIFLVSGFWHGANWTFIVWGFVNVLFIIPSVIFKTNRNNLEIVAQNSILPKWYEVLQIITTFVITALIWVFFRAKNLTEAFYYLSKIFSASLFQKPIINSNYITIKWLLILLLFLMTMEWLGRKGKHALESIIPNCNGYLRWLFYLMIILMLVYFGAKEQSFIYFQF
ncbi:MBOAT family O-acyltransferase [Flavobacterium sp.]|jgi:D-alanyl-lipoteichoic acid acyltransferase DltB (MBOAT superfamily)|uniref:MBOAT family O-acyltransferase n=1 Tax=Flavobacterium sp. TaxID=239 RepID=UPI002A817D42|nr:MBOAT family O-acyltransferase [Flavobacterium sp.]